MRLEDLKPGDQITHWCAGALIEGTVTANNGRNVTTKHEPVNWGNDNISQSTIMPSSYLQFKWGGKDSEGKPAQGPHTTPGAYYKGEPLTTELSHN